MGDTINIAFCTASRSERALIEPIVRRLRKHPRFDVLVMELPTKFTDAIYRVWSAINGTTHFVGEWSIQIQKPLEFHLAFCPFDRVEMFAAATAFFLKNVPIAQIHAGDISKEGTHDDTLRHQITLMTDIQFCNGEQSYQRAKTLLELAGKSTDSCFEIGSIQFDDLTIKHSAVPDEEFDLVLYNPPTRKPYLIHKELDEIELLLERHTLWIMPNEDDGRETIIKRIEKLERNGKVKGIDTVEREDFFGLLEKSERCIGNSSSFFVELPYFNKEHIHIGVRNKGRERVEAQPGGSDRIIKCLEEIYP